MLRTHYFRIFFILLCIGIVCVLPLSLSSCNTENNYVQRDLSNYDFKFEIPGVTGRITKMEFCNLNAQNEDNAYVNIEVEWSDFYNFNRAKRREAESYYLGFTQNDRTYYKLVIPSSEDDTNTEVKLNNTKLNHAEDISVDLFKVNLGEYPIREFIIHLFNIPAE